MDLPPMPKFSSGSSLMVTVKNCSGICVISEAVAVDVAVAVDAAVAVNVVDAADTAISFCNLVTSTQQHSTALT